MGLELAAQLWQAMNIRKGKKNFQKEKKKNTESKLNAGRKNMNQFKFPCINMYLLFLSFAWIVTF